MKAEKRENVILVKRLRQFNKAEKQAALADGISCEKQNGGDNHTDHGAFCAEFIYKRHKNARYYH